MIGGDSLSVGMIGGMIGKCWDDWRGLSAGLLRSLLIGGDPGRGCAAASGICVAVGALGRRRPTSHVRAARAKESVATQAGGQRLSDDGKAAVAKTRAGKTP